MNISNFEIAQATIELFGASICFMALMLLSLNERKERKLELFKHMFLIMGFVFIADSGTYIFRGNAEVFYVWACRVCNLIVFSLNIVLTRAFVRYVHNLAIDPVYGLRKQLWVIVDLSVIIDAIIVGVNLFNGWMYYFDENNLYHRNTMWYLYMGLLFICMIIAEGITISNRIRIKKSIRLSVILFPIIPIVAVVVQMFYYGLSISNIAVGVGLFLMFFVYLRDGSKDKMEGYEERRDKKPFLMLSIFGILIISIGASIISCIISISRISKSSSKNDRYVMAHMVANKIDVELMKPIIVSETMASDYGLKNLLINDANAEKDAVTEMSAYLNSIRENFGYQMVFSVSDDSRKFYTYKGLGKVINTEEDEHDVWYTELLEQRERYVLNVDTDENNHWDLSVFVNMKVFDKSGNYIGACGVGVEMKKLQKMIREFEKTYNIKVDLIDKDGLILIDSDARRIENEYMDCSYLSEVVQDEFYYRESGNICSMTTYMDKFDWYLVVTDANKDKINAMEVTMPSIIVFVIGLVMMAVTFAFISNREKMAYEALVDKRKMAVTDELTGIYNRRAYDEACARIIEEDRVKETIIVIMDVNGLKTVNDQLGHDAGDEIIIGAAHCLQNAFEKIGDVYRTGGDEFAALLTCGEDALMDALVTHSHLVDSWKGIRVDHLSVAKGYVICKEHEKLSFEEMKALADKLMYENKAQYKKSKQSAR